MDTLGYVVYHVSGLVHTCSEISSKEQRSLSHIIHVYHNIYKVFFCTGDADYSNTSGECCFEANQKETTCTIQLVVDSVTEDDEVLRITLATNPNQSVCEAPGTTTDVIITEMGKYGTSHSKLHDVRRSDRQSISGQSTVKYRSVNGRRAYVRRTFNIRS